MAQEQVTDGNGHGLRQLEPNALSLVVYQLQEKLNPSIVNTH